MPGVFGNKRKEKEKLINNLEEIFEVNHFVNESLLMSHNSAIVKNAWNIKR